MLATTLQVIPFLILYLMTLGVTPTEFSDTILGLTAHFQAYVFTQPLHQGQDVTQCQFYIKPSRFKFRVFFLLDWLPNQGQRIQPA